MELQRKEPLTEEFLKHLFSSQTFANSLSRLRTRIVKSGAEGGFIVYKKVGYDNFVMVEREGSPQIEKVDKIWSMTGDLEPRVYLWDSREELESRGIDPRNFVRVGQGHFHPPGGLLRGTAKWFTFADLESFDERVLGRYGIGGTAYYPIPIAYESFDLLGIPPYPPDTLDLIGFSLPLNGLKSNRYQGMRFQRWELQEKVLRECGFRTMKVTVPIERGRVRIDTSVIEQLSQLGE